MRVDAYETVFSRLLNVSSSPSASLVLAISRVSSEPFSPRWSDVTLTPAGGASLEFEASDYVSLDSEGNYH